jgi:nucleotidyltransferase substrate binding protein (TIGR01987 family)
MERLKIKHNDALRSLKTLGEILKEPFSMIVRDATIQRFECTFEAIWKFLKEYLREKEGIISNSPKRCFKEIFPLGFLTEEETVRCLEMTDRRNDTSHTYILINDRLSSTYWIENVICRWALLLLVRE